MPDYVIKGLTEEEAETADAFAQAEFDEEERWRQADMLKYRIDQYKPHEGLKSLRAKLGITQQAMANTAKVTRRTYQFYESGQKPVPSTVLIRLSATYDFDLHELFTGNPHADNLRVLAETAKLAADVAVKLAIMFKKPAMRMDEIHRIAMEVARSQSVGTSIKQVDIIEAVEIVTGEKYVQRRDPSRDDLH